MKKAIFLDRDGTINKDNGYMYKTEELEILDGVIEGLLYAQNKGYLLIIITNQSGINRGYFSVESMKRFNEELKRKLLQYNIHIDDIYYCPHKPSENCSCRKPSPDLVFKAKEKYNIDLEKSFFIGDKDTDTLCAKKCGCKSIRIKGNYENNEIADYTIVNMKEIKNIV